jgi:O-antigen/teichoic acid export membrane protein
MENSIFRNMLKLSGSTTITQIMGVLVLPILSRLYSPEDFGIYALFFSISNILLILGTWNYHMAIVLPKDNNESISLFFLSILLLFSMSIIFLIFIILFDNYIVDIFKLKNLSDLILLIPLHIFISGIYQILRYLNSRNNAFGNSAKSNIINSGLTYLLQIVLGFLLINKLGLVYGSILGILIATIYLLAVSIRFINIKSINFVGIKNVFYKYKKFPIYTTPGNFLSGIGSQLPVLLLTSLFGATLSGFYSIANKAINMPSRIITWSISEVSYKHVSDIVNDDKILSKYIEKSMASILQISIIPFLIILIFGKSLATIFLGEQWSTAGLYVQILSPLVFLEILGSPVGVLYQKNRNDIVFKLQLIYLLFSILGLSSGYILGSATISLINFSLLLSILNALSIYISFRYANASFKNMFYNFRNTFYLKKIIKQIGKKEHDLFI